MKGLTPQQMNIRLENFKQISQHKILGSMFYAAAKPMEDEQKRVLNQVTTKRTGNLEKSIGRVRVPIKKANELGAVRVGPRRGGQYKGYHGHLIEFGTKDRYTKRGKYTGRGPRLPFVEPAYRNKKDEVESRMGVEIGKVLKRWERSGKIQAI